ncbi:putative ENTR1 family protein-like [Senna tora]|uniref:Putative ENTR1 family protein-like n=1 Tax=Senna tora TaxID=362788 RepID=A0A834SWQ3_9FABA|nr:putative ENTR1 family protein-like [Senna tora]
MVRNPSFPQPNLLSADELIVDGVLRPLDFLSVAPKSDPSDQTPQSDPPETDPGEEPDPGPAISAVGLSASKRWRDIFKKSDKKNAEANSTEGKGKKKERRSGGGGGGGGSAELNIINIWPFSRSRSAGNGATRPVLFPGASGTRRVNSAPCSRSNSAGESKSKKWPSSPGRAGVHLGRSSPVWQVRRSKNPDPNAEKGSKTTTRRSKAASAAVPVGSGVGSSMARVLNLNVPMCIGYKQHLSCRSDENSAISASGNTIGAAARVRGSHGGGNGGAGGVEGSGGNLFNLRSIFSKKSVVTSH